MELEILRQIISEVLQVDPKEVFEKTTFVDDLGADSLDIMRILIAIQEKFGVALSRNCLYTMENVSDAITAIKEAKNK